MRGLTKASSHRAALVTGGAVAALAAMSGLVMAGCHSSGAGVRKEGWADEKAAPDAVSAMGQPSENSAWPSARQTSHTPAEADVIALIRADPEVSPELKANLRPCAKNRYPVEVAHASLTGAPVKDVVVNVTGCQDGFGLGSYVYRKNGKHYENVFADERPPLYADADRGELKVTTLVYAPGDAVCCPSGEDEIRYRWQAAHQRFVVSRRLHIDYGTAVESESVSPAPATGEEG